MGDEAPANSPPWLRWAAPAFLLAVVLLLVIAHRAQWKPDWINVAAQLVLAALLFWYVLETRRVANETWRLALQGEAQLALLREQDRQRLAPWRVDQEVVVEEDATHVRQSFVIPAGGPSQFAHRVLPPLLEVLDKPVPLASELRAAVTAGFAAGAVKHGCTIQPASMPKFLHSGAHRRTTATRRAQ